MTPSTIDEKQEMPDTAVGKALRWMMSNLNGGFNSLSKDEVSKKFDATFLQAVPPATFLAMSAQLVAQGPFTFLRFDKAPSATEAVAVVSDAVGQKSRLIVRMTPQKPHLIAGMMIQPAIDLNPPAATNWQDFDSGLAKLASSVNFFAGEIVGGELRSLRELNSENRLALGSAFKLYILGEIANQVQSGKASWDEELTIKEQWKSLPSGEMMNAKAGASFKLQHFAEQMISVSDNTATDHLLFRAGRENVEKFQGEMGHAKPELNVPFLSTRDMFVVKLGPAKDAQTYINASVEGRRELLDGKVAKGKPDLKHAARWTKPRLIDDLEWFASAKEMGLAMMKLKEMSEIPALSPIRKILSINPGLPFDKYLWKFIGYKGGSEPGVLNMTWLLQKFDDRWFVMSTSLNDQENMIDTGAVAGFMLAAAMLLGQEKKSKAKKSLSRK